ncbi:prepilin peptidase [Gemella cuniculi]|uniref:prepilin peptidase n=1 Tax=Gemella cuniculi TaxID=150240 RepID=UPI00041DEF31|nr:prepilin peptidase [Gemella cuniculi]
MESYILNFFVLVIVLIFSSFTKCFIDSENKKSFLIRRSCCGNCKRKLRACDLIPIFSFLVKKGKCTYCNEKIPLDVFLYEVLAGTIVILYFIFQDYFIFLSFIHILIIIFLIFISIEDCRFLEVLEPLFIIFLLLNILLLLLNFGFFRVQDFLILIFIFHGIYFGTKGGLGYGDIKVFCVLALNLNIYEGIYLLIFTFLYAGFFAIFLVILKRVKKGTKIPLVPFITLGYITVILLKESLLW